MVIAVEIDAQDVRDGVKHLILENARSWKMSENYTGAIFFDGDFPTGKPCKYHCCPTCHPAQVSEEWMYGCTHPIWPSNKIRDFVPIVECSGLLKKCQIPKKFLDRAITGRKTRIHNLLAKAKAYKDEIKDYEKFLKSRGKNGH